MPKPVVSLARQLGTPTGGDLLGNRSNYTLVTIVESPLLGGGLKHLLFSSLFGEMIQFD